MALEPVPSMSHLVVIAHDDPGTADSLRHAVETATGWQVVLADPSPAGLTAALAAGPSVALVGCAALASLPAGCRTPLVAIGDDDRPADVRAALGAGARSLLAWPDGVADLPGELVRVAATGPTGAAGGVEGLVVATRGVQGGAGTTTVAVHLAAAWARWGPSPVLLLDLAGGLAFRLDLGAAAPTWSTFVPELASGSPAGHRNGSVSPLASSGNSGGQWAGGAASAGSGPAAAGTSIDGAGRSGPWAVGAVPDDAGPLGSSVDGSQDGSLGGFLEDAGPEPGGAVQWSTDHRAGMGAGVLDGATRLGTLAQPWAGLSVLPLAGLADGAPDPPPEPRVVQHVLEVARTSYRVVVADLPATDGPAVRAALSLADALVAVGRCETAAVRGLQAAIEAWTASGHEPDTAGAVVTGVRPRAPLAPREVRAALGDRLWALIPTAAAELAAAAEDGVLLLDRHDLSAVQAMVTLANRVVPFAAVSA